MGIVSAINAGNALDYLIRAFVVISMGIPPFVLALFLQLIFAKWLDWFPLEGRLAYADGAAALYDRSLHD